LPYRGEGGFSLLRPATLAGVSGVIAMSKIEEIKKWLGIKGVADLLKAGGFLEGLRAGANRLEAICPFHVDREPSLSLYLNTDRFYCYSCQAKGDLVDLYARAKGLKQGQAIKELNKIAQKIKAGEMVRELNLESLRQALSGQRPEPPERKRKARGLELAPELKNEVFTAIGDFFSWKVEPGAREYLHRRGLEDKTIERFKVFSIKGPELRRFLIEKYDLKLLNELCLFSKNRFLFHQHRVLIPIIENGLIVGLQGRYFVNGRTEPPAGKGIGKYNITSEITGKIFNGDILKSLEPGTKLYLCEGVFDTMILEQAGLQLGGAYRAVGVLGVSHYRPEIIDRLKDFDLIIAFDNDEAGNREAYKALKHLKAIGKTPKRFTFPDGVKDVNEWYIYKRGLR